MHPYGEVSSINYVNPYKFAPQDLCGLKNKINIQLRNDRHLECVGGELYSLVLEKDRHLENFWGELYCLIIEKDRHPEPFFGVGIPQKPRSRIHAQLCNRLKCVQRSQFCKKYAT
ncbi:MAG: hypothetical protein ACI9CF_000624 [Candidatus Omnitrophota bacterium]|jgi:hypothetical protein